MNSSMHVSNYLDIFSFTLTYVLMTNSHWRPWSGAVQNKWYVWQRIPCLLPHISPCMRRKSIIMKERVYSTSFISNPISSGCFLSIPLVNNVKQLPILKRLSWSEDNIPLELEQIWVSIFFFFFFEIAQLWKLPLLITNSALLPIS